MQERNKFIDGCPEYVSEIQEKNQKPNSVLWIHYQFRNKNGTIAVFNTFLTQQK